MKLSNRDYGLLCSLVFLRVLYGPTLFFAGGRVKKLVFWPAVFYGRESLGIAGGLSGSKHFLTGFNH